jgi:hypothetical protein
MAAPHDTLHRSHHGNAKKECRTSTGGNNPERGNNNPKKHMWIQRWRKNAGRTDTTQLAKKRKSATRQREPPPQQEVEKIPRQNNSKLTS